MSENAKLLIIESMQLAIVALIVIVCIFNPRLAIIKKPENVDNTGFFDEFFRNFIALGFVGNLVYIFCNLGQSDLAGWFTEGGTSDVVATIADLCTASAFLYGSLEGRVTRHNRWILGGVVCGVSVALAVFNFHREHLFLHFYSFITYSAVAAYVFRQVGKAKQTIKNTISTSIFGIGFLLWALLQLLPIWMDITGGDLGPVRVYGFGGSTLGKALILLGIYHFSMRMAQYATVKEREQNDELVIRQKNIRALPKLINEVSNSSSTDTLAATVTRHLNSKDIFDFDYAIFSEVDYLHRRIIYKDSKSSHESIRDVGDWVVNTGIPFDSHDIMARVVSEKVTKYVYGNLITVKDAGGKAIRQYRIDLTKLETELNAEVFNKYQHMSLDRVFIPVFYINGSFSLGVSEHQDSHENQVIAIVEAGKFVHDRKGYASGSITAADELKLYLDNSSQAYQRLYEEDVRLKIELLLDDCQAVTKDEHIDYVRRIVNGMAAETRADGVVLCLYYKNRTTEQGHSTFFFSPGQDRNRKDIEERLQRYIEHNPTGKSSAEYGLNWLKERIRRNTGSTAVRCFEERVDGSVQAYWLFYSKEEFFFNDVVKFFIESVTRRLIPSFNEKKFHSSTAKLVSPNSAFTDLEVNIKPLILSLQDYFETSFVSIWKKGEDDAVVQLYGSEPLQQKFKNFKNVRIPSAEIDSVKEPLLLTSNDDSFYCTERHLVEFINKNNIQSILNKTLVVDGQLLGNISIYFKEIVNPNTDDLTYLYLVGVKAQINFQIYNLITGFKTISDSFTRNDLDDTLQTIADQAKDLLNADPVLLFRSFNGRDIFFKDNKRSVNLPFMSPVTADSLKQKVIHVEVAERILADKSQFFNEYTEYIHYVKPGNTGIPNFWVREGIQSMAAIRLSNRIGFIDKPVGVMFINFRHKVSFDSNAELKNIIETFASFAAGSMANGYVMERNMQYMIRNVQLSQPVIEEMVAQGTLHDAHKAYLVIHNQVKFLNDRLNAISSKLTLMDVKIDLKKINGNMDNVVNQFEKLELYYRAKKDLQIKKCSLAALIRLKVESLEQDIHTKSLEFIDSFSKENITIECDEGLLGDALYNIMNNACQAMRKRDRLEVRARTDGDRHVKIDVIDSGPGINPDLYDFILKPWITDKVSGSGLGLPMAKYTVERHGGELSYDSKKGKTTFTILIPIQQPKKAPVS